MGLGLKDTYLAACERCQCKPNSALLVTFDSRDQTTWNLKNNYIGAENAFKILLELIQANEVLRELDLSGNFLSTENVRSLVDVLVPHPTINVVRLNNNRLYIDSGKDLLRLARRNKRVVVIDIEDATERNDNKVPAKILGQIRRELNRE
uniref:Uncharacterized protein n=1 Tax=Eutreptiella gymnastica TaxID=73025 RepID=A0A7S1NEG3_9EUGL|mmetsp:Transcript_25803/g.46601  ORF Transcript_25803/g.46601 Transcript_25803/m.46601 type:complete len:150 (+) Transcript_25803:46-495(+)